MTVLTIAQAQKMLPKLVSSDRAILARRGKHLTAIVPIMDPKAFKVLEDYIDVIEAAEALAEAKRKGTIPLEKIKKELGL